MNLVLAPQAICDLFATIAVENSPSHVPQIYERHYEVLTENYPYKFQRNGISLSHDESFSLGIYLITNMLREMTNTEDEYRMYGIPVLTDVMSNQCEKLLESLSEINE